MPGLHTFFDKLSCKLQQCVRIRRRSLADSKVYV
jgi:hypothetical protein